MKSWLDLTDKEKAELKVEFDMKFKHKILDFRYILYPIAFFASFIVTMLIISKNNGACTTPDCSEKLGISFAIAVISFLLAFINSEIISKRKKKFTDWLKTRNIIK